MVIWFRDQIMPSFIIHEKLNFPMFSNAFHVLTKRLIIHALVETFSNLFFSFFWSSLFLLSVIWISSTMFFFIIQITDKIFLFTNSHFFGNKKQVIAWQPQLFRIFYIGFQKKPQYHHFRDNFLWILKQIWILYPI